MAEDLAKKMEQTHLGPADSGKTVIGGTGVVYDAVMVEHRNETDINHPECPDRIVRIWDALISRGYVNRCVRIHSRNATQEEITLVHSKDHWDCISGLPSLSSEELFQKAMDLDSIYLNKGTFPTALMCAGCVVELTEAVVTGKVKNGIAVTRPPGHHAEREEPKGFCFFNNVPIAIRHVQKKCGVKKVLVVDWDVHHGQATQHIFYEDPSVLYISIHRFDHGFFYPGLQDGNSHFVGDGSGKGYNINVPWNKSGMGDGDYIAAFNHVVLPVAYEFDPDLVMISCGLDAALGDPLGSCCITPEGYAHLTHMLMGLANGRVVVALEGGYNLTSISNSMCAITGALLGDPLPRLESPIVPCRSAMESISATLDAHTKYWKNVVPLNIDKMDGRGSPLRESGIPKSKDVRFRDEPAKGVRFGDEPAKTSEQDSSDNEDDLKPGPGYLPVPDERFVGLKDKNKEIIEALEDQGHNTMFAVTPKRYCDHVDTGLKPIPEGGLDVIIPCKECAHVGENWVCLCCYEVHCSRYVNKHMVDHNDQSKHPLALSYADLSIWCYACDDYIDNEDFSYVLHAAHKAKFGAPSSRK